MSNLLPLSSKESLSKKLQELRESRGLLQDEVAEAIHYSKRAYRSWEIGEREAKIDALSKLADFYGVSCDYLLGRMSEKTHDIQFIHDETGLSEKAITVLKYSNDSKNRRNPDTMQNKRIIDFINISLDSEAYQIENLPSGNTVEFKNIFTLLYDYIFADGKGVIIKPDKVELSYDMNFSRLIYDTLPLLRETIITEVRKELEDFIKTKKQGKKPR